MLLGPDRSGTTAVGISGPRVEGDETPVGRERRVVAALVALLALRRDAHPLGCAQFAVADEDVELPVGVARDQVGGVRVEGDEAAVGRDRRPAKAAVAVGLLATLPDAD